MADERYNQGDKTEEPTLYRLREARRKGQVVKSAEFNSAFSLLMMMLALLAFGDLAFRSTSLMLRSYLGSLGGAPDDPPAVLLWGREVFDCYIRLMAPVFLAAVVAGVTANLLQVGFLVTPSLISPRLDRLNPLSGLQRIISRRALFELFKVLVKVALIGTIIFYYVRHNLASMILLVGATAEVGASVLWRHIVALGLRVGGAFFILALLDYLYQRREHMRQLRMTRQEVKEEFKQLEGDPHLRARIRERQQHLARQRMLSELPTADVVITNPTQIAVALRYDESKSAAPVLVAKGAGQMAARIRELAGQWSIPVVQDKTVARLIFYEVELQEEIPVQLYKAVAEILAMVYRIKPGKGR